MLCHQPCVQGKKEKLGKVEGKASAEELQGPSLHSAPGYFYAFYFPSNELFTFFSFSGATIICACPCVTHCTGQKARRRVGGHWNVYINLSLFDFNYRDCFVVGELSFYIKLTAIVDCFKLAKVIVLQLLIHFL